MRYGIIGSLVANRAIKKGEEILSNYGLYYGNMCDKGRMKSWYYDNWQTYKANHPEEQEYIKWAENENREYYQQITVKLVNQNRINQIRQNP